MCHSGWYGVPRGEWFMFVGEVRDGQMHPMVSGWRARRLPTYKKSETVCDPLTSREEKDRHSRLKEGG